MSFRKIVFLLCFASIFAFAEDASEDDFQRYSVVPILGYTEETEFQIGVMSLLFLRPDEPNGKVPEIGLTAYGSTRGQLQLQLEPYYYLFHDQVSIWGMLKYIESRIGLPQAFKYGVEVHAEYTEIDFEKGKIKDLPDDHSGWRNGVGYLFGFDTRDNINWTRHGFLAQWQQMFYSDRLGDYTFDVESLDLRGYSTWSRTTTLAVGFLWQRANGDVPFDMLAGPDGICRFRGVESLYFGDNQAVIVQTELRQFIWWRLGAHTFFEGGKSGRYFSELVRNDWHRSVGAGALLGLNLKQTLFARADFSWVDFDHLGMSFYVRQAF